MLDLQIWHVESEKYSVIIKITLSPGSFSRCYGISGKKAHAALIGLKNKLKSFIIYIPEDQNGTCPHRGLVPILFLSFHG